MQNSFSLATFRCKYNITKNINEDSGDVTANENVKKKNAHSQNEHEQ